MTARRHVARVLSRYLHKMQMRTCVRSVALVVALLAAGALPIGGLPTRDVRAQSDPTGRILAPTRGQVGWLNLVAPRPTLLTNLQRPDYPADVAAVAGAPFGVVSLVRAFGGKGAAGGDLLKLDLASGAMTNLLSRGVDTESLDMPALWPDGSTVLFQRSDLHHPLGIMGQAAPQYQSNIEQIAPDGSGHATLVENGRYPAPAPDGSEVAFVRSTSAGTGMFVHSMLDGSEVAIVPPGQFLALAYPRYSADGRQLAFVAVEQNAPIGTGDGVPLSWFGTRSAEAHGFPWDIWIMNADGSNLHSIPDLMDDDPSVAWSPDQSQLLVYGGWAADLIDLSSGNVNTMTYLAGYGAVAWLPN